MVEFWTVKNIYYLNSMQIHLFIVVNFISYFFIFVLVIHLNSIKSLVD